MGKNFAKAVFFHRHKPKMAVALLLTFASGLVDIIGYLGIFHFFTAHLTGTTVQLGHSLVNRNEVDLLAALVIIGAFLWGSIAGRTLIEIGSRRYFRKVASVTLTIEAVILSVLACEQWEFFVTPYWGLAALAAAMGVQTATLTGIGPLTVHTTFVTGMLNKIAQLVSHIAFRTYDLLKSKITNAAARQARAQDVQMTLFLLGVWLFYVLGAAVGTWSYRSWGFHALFIAVGVLAIGFTTDQFWPLSIREEKEQSEL